MSNPVNEVKAVGHAMGSRTVIATVLAIGVGMAVRKAAAMGTFGAKVQNITLKYL